MSFLKDLDLLEASLVLDRYINMSFEISLKHNVLIKESLVLM
jgi:hypothetical protein